MEHTFLNEDRWYLIRLLLVGMWDNNAYDHLRRYYFDRLKEEVG